MHSAASASHPITTHNSFPLVKCGSLNETRTKITTSSWAKDEGDLSLVSITQGEKRSIWGRNACKTHSYTFSEANSRTSKALQLQLSLPPLPRACVDLPRRQAAVDSPRLVRPSEQHEKLSVDCEPEQQRNVSGTVTPPRRAWEDWIWTQPKKPKYPERWAPSVTSVAPALVLPLTHSIYVYMYRCIDGFFFKQRGC